MKKARTKKMQISKIIGSSPVIWILFAFLFLFQFLLQSSPSVMVSSLVKHFNTSELGVSILASSFFYTYATLQIPAGILVDRCNIKYIFIAGLAILSLASIYFTHSNSFQSAMLTRIIMGIAALPGLVGSLYIANQWFPKKYFALFVGLVEMVGLLGAAFGQTILAQGVIHFGWQNTLTTMGIAGLLVTFIGAFIVRENPKVKHREKLKRARGDYDNANSFVKDLGYLLSSPYVWVSGIICGIGFAIVSAFAGFWCIPFLVNKFSFSLGHAAMLSALVFASAGISTPLLGSLASKIDNKSSVMMWGFLILGLLFLPIVFLAHLPTAIIIILLCGIGFLSGIYVLPFAMVRAIVPNHISATAMGATNMLCVIIGAPILQPLIGSILHAARGSGLSTAHSYSIAMSLMAVAMFASTLLCLWLKRLEPHS